VSAALGVLLLGCTVYGQNKKKEVPRPTEFEMGVLTFFDFGPPNEYYSLYIARPMGEGSQVERLILTPEANRCFAPAKLEKSIAVLQKTVDELLGSKNPCAIPEKVLKKERKRCRHCLRFSGSNVTMRVNCAGGEARLIRSDILDQDMFDPAVKTPENTAWTMGLLSMLEKASGPGVMDKPMFAPLEEPESNSIEVDDAETLNLISRGDFDGLFASGTLKFSELFRQTQTPSIAHPTVTITEIKPAMPVRVLKPAYPPITFLTHSEGSVTATFSVLDDGTPNLLTLAVMGNQLFKGVVEDALRSWKFSQEVADKQAEATFEFLLNCQK
jgi:hypothetical protein